MVPAATVDEKARDGKEHCRGDGHEHVVARELAVVAVEDALEQVLAVLEEHLVKALCPAHALAPRILERGGLLVVDVGVAAVPDADAVGDAVGGELDVLGHEVVDPAAV